MCQVSLAICSQVYVDIAICYYAARRSNLYIIGPKLPMLLLIKRICWHVLLFLVGNGRHSVVEKAYGCQMARAAFLEIKFWIYGNNRKVVRRHFIFYELSASFRKIREFMTCQQRSQFTLNKVQRIQLCRHRKVAY